MCTGVEETNIESTLAVMNTTELVVEIRPEKNCENLNGTGRGSQVVGKLSRVQEDVFP